MVDLGRIFNRIVSTFFVTDLFKRSIWPVGLCLKKVTSQSEITSRDEKRDMESQNLTMVKSEREISSV